MSRLESIKEQLELGKKHDTKYSIPNDQVEYLLQRLESYEKALELAIKHLDGKGEKFSEREKAPVLYQLKEALKDETHT